ncbi:39660_t:CDS:2, partial [Gigaspora margarita]
IALSRKVMLELLKYSTTNYGTDEVQKQIVDQRLKQISKIKKLVKNIHKEVIVKKANDFLIENNKNPIELNMASKSEETSSTMLQKSITYNFTSLKKSKQTESAALRIEALKKAWTIHFEDGKT